MSNKVFETALMKINKYIISEKISNRLNEKLYLTSERKSLYLVEKTLASDAATQYPQRPVSSSTTKVNPFEC